MSDFYGLMREVRTEPPLILNFCLEIIIKTSKFIFRKLLRERITEHGKNENTEVSEHLRECEGDINQESFKILYKINNNKGLMHLRTAEALFIHSNKPSLNNKD